MMDTTMDTVSRFQILLWSSLWLNICCMQGQFGLMIVRLISSVWRTLWCKHKNLFQISKTKSERNVQIINRFLDTLETQVLGWMAIYFLATEAIPAPFLILRGQPSRNVMMILSFHLGKLIYKIYHELCIEHRVTKSLYYLVHFASFFTFLFCGSNALLGLMAMACELSDFYVSICKVLDVMLVPKYSLYHLTAMVVGLVVTLGFRVLMPVVMLCLALEHSNPLYMDNLDIVMFFFYLTFFLSINLWFTIYSLLKLQEHIMIRRMYNITRSHLTELSLPKTLFYNCDVKAPIYKQWCSMIVNAMKPSSSVKTIISPQQYPDIITVGNKQTFAQ